MTDETKVLTTATGCTLRVFPRIPMMAERHAMMPGLYLALDMGSADMRYAEVRMTSDEAKALGKALIERSKVLD